MPYFDLTPDPKVLIALTHTPMQPLDSLCELIDNAIDSFRSAKIQGIPNRYPLVSVELPRPVDINNNVGILRVTDNGPGLNAETAEKAIKAGFSGNNPYDTLGLFGMGFNISTGKIGRVTKFRTAREENDHAIEVNINLEIISQSKNYKVAADIVPKEESFPHGTIVEISHWWPEGNPNRGFLKKLVQYGVSKIREELGRRYGTILRDKEVRILVNGEPCESFEHCVWDDSRFVERRNYGRIPAAFRLNEVIGAQKRCGTCTALIESGQAECPSCGSMVFRTIEERIRGWVGIQRFDSPTDFGIDLIRNGRTIRIAEKNAFFEFVDEFKKTIKDYPIDNPYGRIIGEVHLDHVPVDFLKQDFQRTSPEWQRAISYLRGDSSLQPEQPGASSNSSVIFKLYQGFRRVRTSGKVDMYMGYWDDEAGKPKRISRDVEKEYYQKFKQKTPGYYEDTEWWKKVEEADTKPLEEMFDCPGCGAQNLKEQDVCSICGYILKGKNCIDPECGKIIPQTALVCPSCGKSQVPEIEEPWHCEVCGARNRPGNEVCDRCRQPKGTENALSKDYLLANSNKDDALSLSGCSIQLSDGSNSTPINVNVYVTNGSLKHNLHDSHLPMIIFKEIDTIDVFIDKSHRIFKACRVHPEQMIASELALYIYDSNRRLVGYTGIHTLSNLSWLVMKKCWLDNMEDSPEKTAEDVALFVYSIKERLPDLFAEQACAYFGELTESQKRELVDSILNSGGDISKLGEMKESGDYLKFISQDVVVDIFKKMPEIFFDGKYWDVPFNNIPLLEDEIKRQAQVRIKNTYQNCLEDIAMFLKYKSPESLVNHRTRMSLEFLKQKVVN